MTKKKIVLVVFPIVICGLLAAIAVSPAENDLAGTYRLISDTRKDLETGEVLYPYGKNPTGYIMYGKEGRMLVLVVGDERPKPASIAKATPEQQAALFRSMLAYGGTYKFDGKKIEHHIDISWNELWTGTVAIREVQKEGNRLIYTTGPAPLSGTGRKNIATLIWEKVK